MQKTREIWAQAVSNCEERSRLVTSSSHSRDVRFLSGEELDVLLAKFAQLISEEFVHIKDEERSEDEVWKDIEDLRANRKAWKRIADLSSAVIQGEEKEKNIREILKKLYHVLKVELHLLALVKRRREQGKSVESELDRLFRCILSAELSLFSPFLSYGLDGAAKGKNDEIALAILSGKQLKTVAVVKKVIKELISADERFIREAVEIMGGEESKHSYKKLGEAIYGEILEMVGAPFNDDDSCLAGVEKSWEIIEDDKVLFQILKKLRPRYDDKKIRLMMAAFRRAFDEGYFEHMNGDLWT
jgi:hypothetical protein